MENQNQKNGMIIFKVIMAIITIICIIVGLWLHVFSGNIFGTNFGNLGKDVQHTVEVKDATKITLDVDIVDLTVQSGDSFYVEYVYPENNQPEIETADGTLKITYHSKKHVSNPFKEHAYSMIITVPSDVKLEAADFSVDAGELDLNDLVCSDVTIDADAGEIHMADCLCEKTSITADAGEIDIASSQLGEATITASAGEVDLADTKMDDCTIKADMGDIEISACTFENGDVKADMGSIDIEGDFTKLTAKCNMGSIDVNTKQDESEVDLDLDADMGSITVNGKDWK